ncbi:MAG: helix-turn-helix transcriptional regulator, partial [Planctomycetes bacterium]|nr:helix-turn-helix transcriptional regulator [Planctomycetota bacterium]
LKHAIERSGLPAYAISKGAGVPIPTITRFLRGERDMRLATAAKLAEFFEMRLTRPKRPK